MQRGSAPKEVSSLQLRINSFQFIRQWDVSGEPTGEPARPCLNPTGQRWLGPTPAPSNLTQPVGFGMIFLPFFSPSAANYIRFIEFKMFCLSSCKTLLSTVFCLYSRRFSSSCNATILAPFPLQTPAPKMPPMLSDFSCLKTHRDKLTNSRPGVVWTDWQIGFLGGPVKAATLLHQVVQAG